MNIDNLIAKHRKYIIKIMDSLPEGNKLKPIEDMVDYVTFNTLAKRGLSKIEIARELGIHKNTVRIKSKKYNIKPKRGNPTNMTNKNWDCYAAMHLQPNPRALLIGLYHNLEMTPKEIGKILSPDGWPVSSEAVLARMRRLGIERRKRGGANNPKGLGGRNRRKE